jgi:hypothetical protein
MTCQDFLAALEVDPIKTTRGTRFAITQHYCTCKACRDTFNFVLRQKLDGHKLSELPEIDDIVAKDRKDPEIPDFRPFHDEIETLRRITQGREN